MLTSRIASGFDIELQLGGGWFLTAVNLLNDHGLLAPGTPVIISNVQITFEPDWDLQIDVLGFPVPILARVQLSADGSQLTITTNLPQVPPIAIPFGALSNLAGTPQLVKLAGDDDHEPALAVLANMNIQAGSQSEAPLPEGEFVARGDPAAAQSFLPRGQHIAFGMGRTTFARFANNLWHTNLRAEDGTHPLPDAENKVGSWSKVTMRPESGRFRLILEGDIPVDSPLIDIVPDPHVTITLLVTPMLVDGALSFDIQTETDVDTGLLGDLFAALSGGVLGAIIGFVVGLLTGGILVAVLVGAAIGAVVGVITLEVAEVVVEGIVQREIKAKLDGEPLAEIHCNRDGIVQIAKPATDGGSFNLSVLDAIPTSIPIHTANPQNEFLYKQSLLVTAVYDELAVNADGFGVAGTSGTEERFQPEIVRLTSVMYEDERLQSLTYRRTDGAQQTLSVVDVLGRAADGELAPPFKIFQEPDDASLRIPEGQLACVCLKPVAIRQGRTIVEEIEFEGGLRLRVPDAIALQDAGALVVLGYQLIHPRDYKSYYRAKADFFKDNNFESLPKIPEEV
jgi:hypothetical protein